MSQLPTRSGPHARKTDLRVLVVGISGAGKTTFAQRLSNATGAALIDIDVVNWRPGWVSWGDTEPEAFIAEIDALSRQPSWAISGSYHSKIGHLLWSRATHAVWLDLPRWRVMSQVIPRSLNRAWSGQDVFPGCRENWARLLTPDHPIRWAWDNHAKRRSRLEQVTVDPAYAHVRMHRCCTRREADAALAAIIADAQGATEEADVHA